MFAYKHTPPKWMIFVDVLWITAGPLLLFVAAGPLLVIGIIERDSMGWMGGGYLLASALSLWQWALPRSRHTAVELVRAFLLTLPAMSLPLFLLLHVGTLPGETEIRQVMLAPPRLGAFLAIYATLFLVLLKVRLTRPKRPWVSQVGGW